MDKVSYVCSKELISYGDLFTFRFASRNAWLNSRPSNHVYNLSPIVDENKPCFNNIEKKIPKKVGARTQPCFTSLLFVNESETLPSYWTVAFVLVLKDFTMLIIFLGQPVINHRKHPFRSYQIESFSKVN